MRDCSCLQVSSVGGRGPGAQQTSGLNCACPLLQVSSAGPVARVWVAMPQVRSDRRRDRVEAGPEQLARCTAAAEEFTRKGGRKTRVVGW